MTKSFLLNAYIQGYQKIWNKKKFEKRKTLKYGISRIFSRKEIRYYKILNVYHLKNTVDLDLQYLFYVAKLFKTIFYLKFIFKLKINQKTCFFFNLKKFRKPRRNFLW